MKGRAFRRATERRIRCTSGEVLCTNDAIRCTNDAITLGSGVHRFDLRVWPDAAKDGGRHVLRRGRWAIDVEAPEALPEPARAALTMSARALPE